MGRKQEAASHLLEPLKCYLHGNGLVLIAPLPQIHRPLGAGQGVGLITPPPPPIQGAPAVQLNKCWHSGSSSPSMGAGLEGGGGEVIKVGDQKPWTSRCRVTAAAGGCIFFFSRLKSLAERHSQVCSSFSSQKSSIFWRKSLWAGPGDHVGSVPGRGWGSG